MFGGPYSDGISVSQRSTLEGRKTNMALILLLEAWLMWNWQKEMDIKARELTVISLVWNYYVLHLKISL